MVTVTTPEPLLPSTSYTLRWSASDAPPADTTGTEDDNGDGLVDDVSARITFTTSSDDDTTAPASPTASHETEVVLANNDCGEQPAGTWARFYITPTNDDVVAAYVLRDVDGAVLDARVAPFALPDDTAVIPVSNTSEESGTKAYQIVAIDHAGNESEPTVINVDLGGPGGCSSANVTGVS
jgi:hypothetical protein